MNNMPIAEDLVEKNLLIYDIDIEVGDFVGELARRSIGQYQNTVKRLRYNNQIIYLNNIEIFFKCFNASDAQFVIHFSRKQTTSTAIFSDAETESKTFTPKMFTLYERRCLKNWMGSILCTPKKKPYSKTLPILTLNQFACHPKN